MIIFEPKIFGASLSFQKLPEASSYSSPLPTIAAQKGNGRFLSWHSPASWDSEGMWSIRQRFISHIDRVAGTLDHANSLFRCTFLPHNPPSRGGRVRRVVEGPTLVLRYRGGPGRGGSRSDRLPRGNTHFRHCRRRHLLCVCFMAHHNESNHRSYWAPCRCHRDGRRFLEPCDEPLQWGLS